MGLFRRQNNESDVPTHKVRDWSFVAVVAVSFGILTGSVAYVTKSIVDRQDAGAKRGETNRAAQLDTCEKVHTLVNVLIQDEVDGRPELDRLTGEGLINRTQRKRLLRSSREKVTRLRTADCDVEALRVGLGLRDGG